MAVVSIAATARPPSQPEILRGIAGLAGSPIAKQAALLAGCSLLRIPDTRSMGTSDLTRWCGLPGSGPAAGTKFARYCQAICAFANDLPRTGRPGVVVIGQSDDGTPRGLPITEALLLELADLRTNGGILPFPQISVRELDLKGSAVAVVIVQPSASPPVRYDGRTYIRVGPSRRLATAEEEAILTERRQAANLPFDARSVASSTIDDLDLSRFRDEILPQLIADDVLRENKRSIEQQLASLRLVTSSELQLLSEHRVSGTIQDVVLDVEEILRANIDTVVQFEGLAREQRKSSVPFEALQQLLRNALS